MSGKTKRRASAKPGLPINDYTILHAGSSNALAGLVNGLIAQGWLPTGGVAIYSEILEGARGSGIATEFFQAMTTNRPH